MAWDIRPLGWQAAGPFRADLAGFGPAGDLSGLVSRLTWRPLLVAGVPASLLDLIVREARSAGAEAFTGDSRPGSDGPLTDLLLAGSEHQLLILCRELALRSPAARSLAAELETFVGPEARAPHVWRIGRRILDLARRPHLMGILNVTPDSFSDGNRFATVEAAVERALRLEEEGADIIDIGGESTRPGAAAVPVEEELRRVVPVVERLAGRLTVPVSVDTTKAEVAAAALAAGAEIVNDISALGFDPRMGKVVAGAGAGVVLMHTRGRPEEMQRDTVYRDVVGEVIVSLRAALEKSRLAGIPSECVVVDPGIGFGKSVAGNLAILRRLGDFASLHRPLLIGTSRKSVIGTTLARGVDERVHGTAATVALALAAGARIFRVHDVRAMRDVMDMAEAICRSPE